jgi:hypothetical protein
MAQRSSDAVRVPGFQPAAVQLIPWRVRRVGSGGAVPGWAMTRILPVFVLTPASA